MTTRLTISNLDPNTTENDIHGLFNTAGLVMAAALNPLQKYANTLTGWVDMSGIESAEAAVKALNGVALRNSNISVSIE